MTAGAFRLRDVSFDVPTGRYGVLMGKTGSGKTTILEAICGLRRISSGRILLRGRDVTREKAANRGVGYVPQDLALFSTMTVREHLGFALSVRGSPGETIEARIGELAEILGIEPLLGRKPQGLSGGEAQRVALGRALAAWPSVLCLDEPLSALDEATREELVGLLKRIPEQTGVTVLHVTHNRTEAGFLADRLLVLQDGRVEEHTPD